MESHDLNTRIGARVKATRLNHTWEKRGLTQTELADRVGVSDSLICQIEAGQTGVSQKVLYAIASALGIDPGDLLPPHTPPQKQSPEHTPG